MAQTQKRRKNLQRKDGQADGHVQKRMPQTAMKTTCFWVYDDPLCSSAANLIIMPFLELNAAPNDAGKRQGKLYALLGKLTGIL